MYFDVNNLCRAPMCEFVLKHSNGLTPILIIPVFQMIRPLDIFWSWTWHKNLPLCPEHRVPPGCNLCKLMTTLHHKEKCISHYRKVKHDLANGLNLKNVHRVLHFKHGAYLKPYTDLNTQQRAQAKNEFENKSFILMNNGVFVKTMENIREHRIVKILNKWDSRYGAKI